MTVAVHKTLHRRPDGWSANIRRKRLLLIATVAPGVVISEIGVVAFHDPRLLALGGVLVLGAGPLRRARRCWRARRKKIITLGNREARS